MAISRHDPNWQRVVSMAALAGAMFTETKPPPGMSHSQRKLVRRWSVAVSGWPAYQDYSKYKCALYVLRLMGVDEKFLPDAATPRTAPSGPDGN